ncbi:hypothetical protein IWQ62_006496 [Dispira parvispora]|uniref:Uncharacterized protein n=1 Tax=Dispira parvispora TaxID=1520584 RepID=A0A9W8AGJ8_9FUNG|nr:hypothetical protein IWQ62_006496 [Dispira parvispora]
MPSWYQSVRDSICSAVGHSNPTLLNPHDATLMLPTRFYEAIVDYLRNPKILFTVEVITDGVELKKHSKRYALPCLNITPGQVVHIIDQLDPTALVGFVAPRSWFSTWYGGGKRAVMQQSPEKLAEDLRTALLAGKIGLVPVSACRVLTSGTVEEPSLVKSKRSDPVSRASMASLATLVDPQEYLDNLALVDTLKGREDEVRVRPRTCYIG